jgi:hypothetical protein
MDDTFVLTMKLKGLIPRGDEYNPMKLVSAPCKIELRSGAVERGGSGGAD